MQFASFDPILSVGNVGILLIFIAILFQYFSKLQNAIVFGIMGILPLGYTILSRTLDAQNHPGIGFLNYFFSWSLWISLIIINMSFLRTIRKTKQENLEFADLKNEQLIIEKPIHETKYQKANIQLENLRESTEISNSQGNIYWTEKQIQNNNRIVKKIILDLGVKLTRLEIMEISEKTGIEDEEFIIEVVLEMISKEEIYAEYFSSSKAVLFNQQANIEEIDNLLKKYEEKDSIKIEENNFKKK